MIHFPRKRSVFVTICIAFHLAFSFTSQASSETPWLGKMRVNRVVAASSPDNAFETLKSVLDSAKKTIHIAVYELDNPFIGDVLEEALDRGVKVKILLEGAPIPKIPGGELAIAHRLVKKGADISFYDDAKGRRGREFTYFHNKYTVVDGLRVIVGSNNYGIHGHPVETSHGNREWELVIHDSKAAALYEAAFQHDAAISDEWVSYGDAPEYKNKRYEENRATRKGHYALDLKSVEDHDVVIETVFAPDNTVSETSGILNAFRYAKESIDIEQLNFETYWGDKPYNPTAEESPLMKRILALAKNGVAIRILLNDDNVFKGQTFMPLLMDPVQNFVDPVLAKAPRDNAATQTYLNKIATRDALKLKVRLFSKECGMAVLHNKGMVIDRNLSLVGSVNWGESAMKFNREAGVIVQSNVIAEYYSKAFQNDWQCSR